MKLFSNFALERFLVLVGSKVMFFREDCEVVKTRVLLGKNVVTLVKDPRFLCSCRCGKDQEEKYDWEDGFHFWNPKSAHNNWPQQRRAISIQAEQTRLLVEARYRAVSGKALLGAGFTV